MNVIFLDIDGVLNTRRHLRSQANERDKKRWCPISSKAIAAMCRRSGARIVVSSTWRYEYDWYELMKIFERNGIPANYVIGKTPYIYSPPFDPFGSRPAEIQKWIDQNAISEYIIIDDNFNPFPSQASHCIHTDPEIGLADKEKIWECFSRLPDPELV